MGVRLPSVQTVKVQERPGLGRDFMFSISRALRPSVNFCLFKILLVPPLIRVLGTILLVPKIFGNETMESV
jgi:hypothetical protein